MTGDGMRGVFITDRVLAGWWKSLWEASDRMGAGRRRLLELRRRGITQRKHYI